MIFKNIKLNIMLISSIMGCYYAIKCGTSPKINP